MVSATVIVIVSTALLLFYLQSVCARVLGRRFEQEYFHAIVNANRLEFPFVRSAVEEYEVPVDYPRFRMQLKCDFLALTYLLRNAANANKRLSRQEWLLVWYFRFTYLFLGIFHLLGLSERHWILRMTRVLEYFANVLGQRVSTVRFGEISASEYLLSL